MNSRSSPPKFKVVEFDESTNTADRRQPSIRFEGSVEDIGSAVQLLLRRAGVTILQNMRAVATHTEAVQCMMHMLEESARQERRAICIEVIEHRSANSVRACQLNRSA